MDQVTLDLAGSGLWLFLSDVCLGTGELHQRGHGYIRASGSPRVGGGSRRPAVGAAALQLVLRSAEYRQMRQQSGESASSGFLDLLSDTAKPTALHFK